MDIVECLATFDKSTEFNPAQRSQRTVSGALSGKSAITHHAIADCLHESARKTVLTRQAD